MDPFELSGRVVLEVLQELVVQRNQEVLVLAGDALALTSEPLPLVGDGAAIEHLLGHVCRTDTMSPLNTERLQATRSRNSPGIRLISLLRGVVNPPKGEGVMFLRASFH